MEDNGHGFHEGLSAQIVLNMVITVVITMRTAMLGARS